MSLSPAQIIREAAARFAPRVALTELRLAEDGTLCAGRAVTYADLYRTTLRFCSALQVAGLQRGDRIAILMHNSIEMVVTEWACLLTGFTWVALNARASAAEVRQILDDSRPAVLIADKSLEPLLAEGVPSSCRLLMTGTDWESFVATGTEDACSSEPGPEDPVRIRYTSGTAGRPKGAVLPRRAYDASVEIVGEVIGPLRADDVLVQVAPMTHAAGAMLLPHVRVGARALLVDRFDAAGFLRVVSEHRGTAAFLVPTMLVRVLEELRTAPEVSTLRTIVYGGASMPVDPLVRVLNSLGPVLVQIYGLTESTWPVTALTREDHVRRADEDERAWRARLASCGRPTRIGAVRIIADGRDVGNGEMGELWVRGRNTMIGYWATPGAAVKTDVKGLDEDGWMHTGDIGFRDGDGFITIVDRLHDMIVSGGFNVYPREVEHALCSHPAVLEAAVVGRPDREWGETVHAAVVLKPDARATAEELIAHCARQIGSYKKPRSLAIVEHLPRNAAGKIVRRALR